SRANQRLVLRVDFPIVAFQVAEMAGQNLVGPVTKRFIAGEIEPNVRPTGRGRPTTAELAKHHEQETTAGCTRAQLQQQPQPLLAHGWVERIGSQFVMAVLPAQAGQLLAETLCQPYQHSIELLAPCLRTIEEQRPGTINGSAVSGFCAFNIDR